MLVFAGVACWMQTGERQTARLRINYLKSILAKDISFFDTEARDSNFIFHISSDAILVQDAIGDKVVSQIYSRHLRKIYVLKICFKKIILRCYTFNYLILVNIFL